MEYNEKKIHDNIKKRKKFHNVFLIILFFLLLIMLFIVKLFINYNQDKDEPNNFFGIYAFDIISQSMVPVLEENDLIIVKKIPFTNLKESDIIVFRNEDKIITHRIVRIFKENNEFVIKTKGDNNKTEDEFVVYENQIYGKVIFNIHGIGKQLRFLHKKNGLMIIIFIIILVYMLYYLKERRKYSRKKVRWKYETKQKRKKYIEEGNDEKEY